MSPLHCVLNWEVFCIDNIQVVKPREREIKMLRISQFQNREIKTQRKYSVLQYSNDTDIHAIHISNEN